MSMSGQDETMAARLLASLKGKHVCPFCGTVRARRDVPCPRCTMEDTSQTRQATRSRIGPWYVLQSRNPSAPGMKFETLLLLVRRGQVTPRSIVRGPTTHQLWRLGARVRGLSREWGICHSCGGAVGPKDKACSHCQKSLEPPQDPDLLLEPARSAPMEPVRRSLDSQSMTESSQIVLPALGDAALKVAPRTVQEKPAEPKAFEAPSTPPPSKTPPQRAAPAGSMLSPKDLAAAFSLDLKSSPKQTPFEEPARRSAGRRAMQWIALLILLAILSSVAAFYVRPDWRQRIFGPIATYIERYRHPVKAVEAAEPPQRPQDAASSKAPDTAGPRQTDSSAAPSRPPLSLQNLPIPVAPGAKRVNPAAPPVPPEASKKEDEWSNVPSEDASSRKPQPAPAKRPAAQVPAEAESPQPSSSADSLQQVRQLWVDAITAEGRGDFNTAIRIYERIKRFPRDLWPGSLELRLTQARKRLK